MKQPNTFSKSYTGFNPSVRKDSETKQKLDLLILQARRSRSKENSNSEKNSSSNTSENFLEKITSEAKQIRANDSSAATKVSNRELESIVKYISKDRQCKDAEAFAALALLAQLGLTANRSQDTAKVEINKIQFSVELIRRALKSEKRTFRRLAKTFASEIKEIAQKNGYHGNLVNKIKLHYPYFVINDENKYWLSEFQTENEDCPKEI